MKSWIKTFLLKIDLFGFPVGVFLAGKSRYKSAFSGFLTVSLLAIFFAITVKSLIAMFTAENIQIKELNKQYSPEDVIKVDSRGLMFAIGFPNKCIYDTLKISVSWRKQLKIPGEMFEEKKIEIPLVSCTQSHFEGNEDYFRKFNLTNFLCPDLGNSYNISGAYTDNIFAFIHIKVSYSTDLTTDNNTECLVKSSKFEVFVTSFHIDADDVTNPAKSIIMSEIYFPLESLGKLKISRDNFFRQITIQTKSNSLIPTGNDTTVIYAHSFETVSKDIINYVENNGNNQTVDFLNLYFRAAFTRTLFFREFSSFTDFLAYIGGVWNPLFFLFMIIGQYYNKRTSLVNLANQLYNFRFEDGGMLNFRRIDETGRRNATENIRKTSYHYNLKSDILSDIEFYLRRDRSLVINIFDLIRFWLSCLLCFSQKKREKRNLYKTAIHNLTQDLDLLYILRSLQDLEKLKNILFDKNQLMLFNFTPKPTITSTNKRALEALNKLKELRVEVPRELTRLAVNSEETEMNFSRVSNMQLSKKRLREGTTNEWFRKNIHHRSRLFEKSKNYTDINTYKDLLRAYFMLKKRKTIFNEPSNKNFQEEVNEKLTQLIDGEMSNLKRLLSVSEEDFYRWIDNGSLYQIPESTPAMRIRVFKPPPEFTTNMSSENDIPEETNRGDERDIELPNFGELMDTRRSEIDTRREFVPAE